MDRQPGPEARVALQGPALRRAALPARRGPASPVWRERVWREPLPPELVSPARAGWPGSLPLAAWQAEIVPRPRRSASARLPGSAPQWRGGTGENGSFEGSPVTSCSAASGNMRDTASCAIRHHGNTQPQLSSPPQIAQGHSKQPTQNSRTGQSGQPRHIRQG